MRYAIILETRNFSRHMKLFPTTKCVAHNTQAPDKTQVQEFFYFIATPEK